MNTSSVHLELRQRTGVVLLAAWLGAVLAVAGCDSLDIKDPNAPNAEDVTLQSLVAGVEGGMRIDYDIYLQVVGTLGREAYFFEPADPRFTGELFTGPLDPGGFLLNRPWQARYRTIRNAVTLMERAAEDAEGAEKAGYDGFAKTVIAYQLLLNLNLLDENGIKIDFSQDINTPFVGKAEAFAEIERYLDEGLNDLNNAGSAFAFELSNGFEGFDTPAGFAQFNRALRARVAIYQNDYGAALDALEGSFVDAGADLDLGVYHVYSTGTGDRLNPVFEVPTASSVKLRAHPSFKADAESGDQRLATKVTDRSGEAGFNPSPSAANGLSSALPVTVSRSSTEPFPIIRNEELLLIRAEANIGQGNLATAEADLNTVRAAAGLEPVTLTASNAVDRLLYERRYSLFMEGHRWVDMRRYGRLGQLPKDQVGEPLRDGAIFSQFPHPQDEVPGA